MSDPRVDVLARKLQQRLSAFGPDHLRLTLLVIRELAHGRPLSPEQTDQIIANLGVAPDAAHQFLRQVTERDDDDQIVGAMGLSLNGHPHRLEVAGTALSAWCALDTLFLPALLDQTARIESPSPVTGDRVRLRVSPERVEEVSPASAVISIVLVDLGRDDMASVEAIWSAFCDHVHYFATRDEAERWAAGRGDIAILTVDEGFALGRRVWSDGLLTAHGGS